MAVQLLNSDNLRGHIETFILGVLLDGPKYGGEIRRIITKKTNGLYEPNEQSLYSAYHRLEDLRLIRGSCGDEKVGATHKYYAITEEGRKVYESNKLKWQTIKQLIDILIG